MRGEQFPRLVRWGLLGSLAAYGAGYLVALLRGPWIVKQLSLFLLGAGVVMAAVAVSAALFLSLRDWPRYNNTRNIAMLLAAAVPLAIALVIAFVLRFGRFHI